MAPQPPRPTSPDTSSPSSKGQRSRGRPPKKLATESGKNLSAQKVEATPQAKRDYYKQMRIVQGSSTGTGRVPTGPSSSKKPRQISRRCSGLPSGKAQDVVDLTNSNDEAASADDATPTATKAAPLAKTKPSRTNGRPLAAPSDSKPSSIDTSAQGSTAQKRKRDQEAASDSSERRNMSTTYHGPVDPGSLNKRFRNDNTPSTPSGNNTPRTEPAQSSPNTATPGPSWATINDRPSSRPQATPAGTASPIHAFKISGTAGTASEKRPKDKPIVTPRPENNEDGASKKDRTGELAPKQTNESVQPVPEGRHQKVDMIIENLPNGKKHHSPDLETEMRKRNTSGLEERIRTAVQPLSDKLDKVSEDTVKLGESLIQAKEETSKRVQGLREQRVSPEALVAHKRETQLALDQLQKTTKSHDMRIDKVQTDQSIFQRQVSLDQDELKGIYLDNSDKLSTAEKNIADNAKDLVTLSDEQKDLQKEVNALRKSKEMETGKVSSMEHDLKAHTSILEHVPGLKTEQESLRGRIKKVEEDHEGRLLLLEMRKPPDGGLAKKCAAHEQEIGLLKESAERTKEELSQELSDQSTRITDATLRIQHMDATLPTRVDDRLADAANPLQKLVARLATEIMEIKRSFTQEKKSRDEELTKLRFDVKKQSQTITSLKKDLAETKKLVQTPVRPDKELSLRFESYDKLREKLEDRVKTLENGGEADLNMVSALKRRVEALEKQWQESAAHRDAVQNLKGSLCKVEKSVEGVQAFVENHTVLRKQLSELQEKNNSAKTDSSDGHSLAKFKAMIEEVQSRISKLEEEASTQRERLSYLETRIDSDESNTLKTRLAEAVSALRKKHDDSEELVRLPAQPNQPGSVTQSLQDQDGQATPNMATDSAMTAAQEAGPMKRPVDEVAAVKAIAERVEWTENEITNIKRVHTSLWDNVKSIQNDFYTADGGDRLARAVGKRAAVIAHAHLFPGTQQYFLGSNGNGGSNPTSPGLQSNALGTVAMHGMVPATSPLQSAQTVPATNMPQQRPASQPQARQMSQAQQVPQGILGRRPQGVPESANQQRVLATQHQRRASGTATGQSG